MKPRNSVPWSRLATGASLAIFTALILKSFSGFFCLTGDEAFVGFVARNILATPTAPLLGEPAHWSAFGRSFPLAYIFYRGPGEFYSALPFVRFNADPVRALWVHSATWAVAGVVVLHGLALALTGDGVVAVLIALALATSTSYVSAATVGVVIGCQPPVVLSMLGIWQLIVAVRRRSAAAWLISCGAMGMALSAAPEAAAPCVALALCAAWLRKELRPLGKSRLIAGVGLVGALGFLPLLLGAAAGKLISPAHATSVTAAGVDNLRYFSNLLLRWDQFVSLCSGTALYDLARHWLVFIAFLAAVAAQVRALLRGGGPLTVERKYGLIPTTVLLVVLFLSPLTLNSLRSPHLLIMLPMSLLMIPLTFRGLSKAAKPRLVTIGLLCLLILDQGAQLYSFRRRFPLQHALAGRSRTCDTTVAARWALNQGKSPVLLLSYVVSEATAYLGGAVPPAGVESLDRTADDAAVVAVVKRMTAATDRACFVLDAAPAERAVRLLRLIAAQAKARRLALHDVIPEGYSERPDFLKFYVADRSSH